MRKSRTATLGLLLGLAVFAAPLAAAAENVGFVPPEVDFEMVEVGDTVVLPLEIQSLGPTPLTITSVALTDGDGAFTMGPVDLPPELEAGESIFVDVTFIPTEERPYMGEITVVSNDRETPVAYVPLVGEGFVPGEEPTARELMDDLLDFFDAAVDAGELDGTGHCWRARRAHLRTFRFKLQLASWLLDWDRTRPTCNQLAFADRRSDGERFDLVEGTALEEVNSLINEVRDSLGCP